MGRSTDLVQKTIGFPIIGVSLTKLPPPGIFYQVNLLNAWGGQATCGVLLLGLFDIRGGLCNGNSELHNQRSEIVCGLTAGLYV